MICGSLIELKVNTEYLQLTLFTISRLKKFCVEEI